MFIRYLSTKQILSLGFQPVNDANLCAETYSLYKIDIDSDIHTVISLYDNINCFQYTIATSLEGSIETGYLTKFSDLKNMVKKHIDDNVVTFFERIKNKKYNEIEKNYIRNKFKGVYNA